MRIADYSFATSFMLKNSCPICFFLDLKLIKAVGLSTGFIFSVIPLTSRTSSKAPSISSGATDKFMAFTRASISWSNAARLPDSISSLSRSLSSSYASASSANSFSCCCANRIRSRSNSSSSGRSRSITSLTPAMRASSLCRLRNRKQRHVKWPNGRCEHCVVLTKVILTFTSVVETLVCDYWNESYWAVLSCGTVYYTVQGRSNLSLCT